MLQLLLPIWDRLLLLLLPACTCSYSRTTNGEKGLYIVCRILHIVSSSFSSFSFLKGEVPSSWPVSPEHQDIFPSYTMSPPRPTPLPTFPLLSVVSIRPSSKLCGECGTDSYTCTAGERRTLGAGAWLFCAEGDGMRESVFFCRSFGSIKHAHADIHTYIRSTRP